MARRKTQYLVTWDLEPITFTVKANNKVEARHKAFDKLQKRSAATGVKKGHADVKVDLGRAF